MGKGKTNLNRMMLFRVTIVGQIKSDGEETINQ